MSAKPSSSSTVLPSAGNIANPVARAEPGGRSSLPKPRRATRARSRAATSSASSALASGTITANSSPPWRKTESSARTSSRSAAADLGQQPVPFEVPEALVDRLEAVEVEQDQGELARRGAVAGDLLGQALVQAAVVADPGQLVAPGQRPRAPRGSARRRRAEQHDAERDHRQADGLDDAPGPGPGAGRRSRTAAATAGRGRSPPGRRQRRRRHQQPPAGWAGRSGIVRRRTGRSLFR